LNSKLDEIHKAASQHAYGSSESVTGGGGDGSVNKVGPPQKPLGGFAGFVSAFGKEIGKDLGIVDSTTGKTAK